MYQNYVFDFYGTLVEIRTDENKTVLWKRMGEIYSAWGAPYTADEMKKAYKKLLAQQEELLPENGEPDLRKVFRDLFLQKGVACDETLEKSTGIVFRALSREKLRVYDYVKETLTELKRHGKGIYLLSNAQTDFTRPEIEMMGLTEYFDGIFISSEAGYKKPSKEFFDKFLEEFQLNPGECLMMGNDEAADIEGAISVGMDSLYIHTEYSPQLEGECKATYAVLDGDWDRAAKILLDSVND